MALHMDFGVMWLDEGLVYNLNEDEEVLFSMEVAFWLSPGNGKIHTGATTSGHGAVGHEQ